MKHWERHAAWIADRVSHPHSRWREAIASVPRHLLVPHWWTVRRDGDGWVVHDGPSDERAWARAAYSDQTLVTQVGALHADHANPDDHPVGRPTSSATLPSLVLTMFRHTRIYDGADVLDVGTGSGYGAAVLAARLGDDRVTSVDVDPYLTTAAAERLDEIGLHPHITTADATGPLTGTYDRIVSTVAVRPIPPSWLQALRPHGRLATNITDLRVILTATKSEDGSIEGRIEWDRAGFMETRSGPGYSPGLSDFLDTIRKTDGDHIRRGRYPVVDVSNAWELLSTLDVVAPGIEHHFDENDDGVRTAWMLHSDGSWARATGDGDSLPTVHQSGPRRLWDIMDDLRHTWLLEGSLPVYGAKVTITPDGAIYLRRGRWQATIE